MRNVTYEINTLLVKDMTVGEAINMNPDTKADYEARIARIEQKEMDAAIGELGTKFKVKKDG